MVACLKEFWWRQTFQLSFQVMSTFSKNLNLIYTEDKNREDGYWSDTSSSSDEDDVPKNRSKVKKTSSKVEVAIDQPKKGETYGQFMKRKAQEEWEWATNPKPLGETSPHPTPSNTTASLSEEVPWKIGTAASPSTAPSVAVMTPPAVEKTDEHVPSGEFQRLLELLGADQKASRHEPEGPPSCSGKDDAPIISQRPLVETGVATTETAVPTARDVKAMRVADSRRFEEQRASEQRFSVAVEALEALVVSQPFVQSVYKFLRANHEVFLSTKLRREVGEFSHADFDIYNSYVATFERVVLKALADSCENFDEEEFFEKLFEPRDSIGSEGARDDPLSFEGWEVLLSLLNFESFVDLMDDFIAASYGSDELSNARSTKAAAKRGLPQKQMGLEVHGESVPVSVKPSTSLRSKPYPKKAPSSADSTLKPRRF
jgi:hypothetical protein